MTSRVIDLTASSSPGEVTSGSALSNAQAQPLTDMSASSQNARKRRRDTSSEPPEEGRWAELVSEQLVAHIPEDDMCDLLTEILQKSEVARDLARVEIQRITRRLQDSDAGSKGLKNGKKGKNGKKTKKRKVADDGWRACKLCHQPYDTNDSDQECTVQYHPGYKEADHEGDFWADHDECHGRIDDLGDVYPEGFIWTCCEEAGNEEGCETYNHTSY